MLVSHDVSPPDPSVDSAGWDYYWGFSPKGEVLEPLYVPNHENSWEPWDGVWPQEIAQSEVSEADPWNSLILDEDIGYQYMKRTYWYALRIVDVLAENGCTIESRWKHPRTNGYELKILKPPPGISNQMVPKGTITMVYLNAKNDKAFPVATIDFLSAARLEDPKFFASARSGTTILSGSALLPPCNAVTEGELAIRELNAYMAAFSESWGVEPAAIGHLPLFDVVPPPEPENDVSTERGDSPEEMRESGGRVVLPSGRRSRQSALLARLRKTGVNSQSAEAS